jgi:hypothetical protein
MVGVGACQKPTTDANDWACFSGHEPFFEGSAELTDVSAGIIQACQSSTQDFSLIYTSNFGEYLGAQGGGILGYTNYVEINNQRYFPYAGQSYLFDLPDSSIFGNTVCFQASNSLTQTCLRAPQPIQAEPLSYVDYYGLDPSKPHYMRWKRDTLNPAGQIFIELTYYDDATLAKTRTHLRKYVVNDRDEAFDILSQLPQGSKAIRVSLTRVNGTSITVGSQQVFLNYKSMDIHFYEISD